MDNPLWGGWLNSAPDNPLAAQIQANPVGTERVGEQSLTMPTPDVDEYAARVRELKQQALELAPTIAMGFVGGSPRAAFPSAGRQIGLQPIDNIGGTAERALASSKVSGYTGPKVEPRPITADYPSGVLADDAGNLTADIEGRTLSAPFVAGRRNASAPDVAVPPEALDAIGKALFGRTPAGVAPGLLRGNAGRIAWTTDPVTGERVRQIDFRNDLAQDAVDATIAHEIGHGIDDIVSGNRVMIKGGVPTALNQSGVLRSELQPVYHELQVEKPAPQKATSWDPLFTPETYGYNKFDAKGEYTAEAIRAYMQNPAWFKSVAPETAKRIRALVNDNPQIAKVIQFNSLAGIAALPGALPVTQQNQ